MKKLAVGLTSAPFSGPPADTATSAKTDIEDEEVSNKTGFGQFETNLPLTIDFSKLKEVDMNSEIKKLEAALSGIGYNIKFASDDESDGVQKPNGPKNLQFFESKNCQKDIKYCIWLDVKSFNGDLSNYEYLKAPAIMGVCNSPFIGAPSGDSEAALEVQWIAPYLSNLNYNRDIFDNLDYIAPDELAINDSIVLDQDYEWISVYNKTTESVINGILQSTDQLNGASTSSDITPSAGKSKGSGPSASKKVRVAVTQQIGSTIKDPSAQQWSYMINNQFRVTVFKDGMQSKTLTPENWKDWNKFATALNGIKSDESKSSAPAAPAAQPAQPAPAPAPAATSTSTSGEVTELLNGQKVVTVGASGTAGGDIIMLQVDSINTGTPIFYIKDGKTGNVAKLGANDGRVRSAISRADARRLAASLTQQGLSPQKIDAFLELMKLERRQNRIPFGRKKREEKMDKQKGIMSSNQADDNITEKSARDLRISRLEKKGIL